MSRRIGDWTFLGCTNLVSVKIGYGLTAVGDNAFRRCSSMTSVMIPNSVTHIGHSAFHDCRALLRVTIGDGVVSIDEKAFFSCPDLTGVYFMGNPPAADGVFYTRSNTTAYHIPGATGWSDTFAVIPTAVWLPELEYDGFATSHDQFGFNIRWANNQTVIVEGTLNLHSLNWTPISTNTLSSGFYVFTDPKWTNRPAYFYRVRSP